MIFSSLIASLPQGITAFFASLQFQTRDPTSMNIPHKSVWPRTKERCLQLLSTRDEAPYG